MTRKRASKLEYLAWFRANADFGPAHSNVIEIMNREFMRKTGKNLPEGYNYASDGETRLDMED